MTLNLSQKLRKNKKNLILNVVVLRVGDTVLKKLYQ